MMIVIFINFFVEFIVNKFIIVIKISIEINYLQSSYYFIIN